MDGHQLCPVRKCRLNLDLADHLGHTVHDVFTTQDVFAEAHQVSHRTSVARPLHQLGADDGDRFRIVQFQSPRSSPTRQLGGHENEQLLLLARCQTHAARRYNRCYSLLAARTPAARRGAGPRTTASVSASASVTSTTLSSACPVGIQTVSGRDTRSTNAKVSAAYTSKISPTRNMRST